MSRSWMTGGGRIGGSKGVKPRSGVAASRLEAPLRAVPRRPLTLWERFRIRLELLGALVDAWRARRRIRKANRP